MAGKQWSAFFSSNEEALPGSRMTLDGSEKGRNGRRWVYLWVPQKKMCTVSVCVGGAETTWNHTSNPTWACAPCMPLWDFASSGKAKTLDLSNNLSHICSIMWPNQLQSLNPPCVLRGLGGGVEFYGRSREIWHILVIWNTLLPEWGLCFESWHFGGVERNTSVALETGLEPYFLAISVISNLTWCSVLFLHLLCQGTTYNLTPGTVGTHFSTLW